MGGGGSWKTRGVEGSRRGATPPSSSVSPLITIRGGGPVKPIFPLPPSLLPPFAHRTCWNNPFLRVYSPPIEGLLATDLLLSPVSEFRYVTSVLGFLKNNGRGGEDRGNTFGNMTRESIGVRRYRGN